MSKFLYPIYKLKTKSYIKWWLYHKKADGSGVLSEILEGFSFNLENTLNRKFKLFDVEGNSVQDGSPSPDNEVPILSSGDNENLLPANNGSETINGVDFAKNSDGTIIANGTATAGINYYINGLDYENIPAGEYTLSDGVGTSGGESSNTFFTFLDGAPNSNSTISLPTFTLSQATNIRGRIVIRSGVTLDNVVFKPKLEKGNKATPYSPYGMGSINEKITNSDGTKEQDYSIPVQQPMRSIGDIRDCFVKVNGNWYERHYIARKIFDGTENWVYSYNNFVLARQSVNTHLANSECLSNIYIYSSTALSGEYGIRTGNADFIQIRDTNYDNVTDFKAMLSEKYANGNPVYVDYILAEPIDLPCTEEQIQQLENKPSTYKDFTIIQSQDETPAHLKIQYYKEG